MKYIIIGFTSDIDIKNNTAKIRYYYDSCPFDEFYIDGWSENIQQAERFNTRDAAEQRIINACLKDCIAYGIEE